MDCIACPNVLVSLDAEEIDADNPTEVPVVPGVDDTFNEVCCAEPAELDVEGEVSLDSLSWLVDDMDEFAESL